MGPRSSKIVRHFNKAKNNASSAKLDDIDQVADIESPFDELLPLDARQKFRLQKSWKGIKRKMTETAVELIIR